jgi:hypothetical protein
MIENEAPQPEDQEADEAIETGEETADFGNRPESPDPGYPVSETEPHEGMPERGHEHPEDVPSPTGEKGEQGDTTSPAGPPDPDSGGS